jgi:hypothetical protein
MKFALAAAPLLAAAATAQQAPPHLAQAWQAESAGDGLKGQTGLESYIYEECSPKGKTSDECVQAHVWDYGAENCIKYEVNRGFDSAFTGTYYVKCDAVNCCTTGKGQRPNVKQWDIGQGRQVPGDKIAYLGKVDTTELNGKAVEGADAWTELVPLPFTKIKINYTYYVTTNGTDVITHRIDYSEPGDPKAQDGSILYGNFQVQHNLTEFRTVFEPPAECLKPNVLQCNGDQVKKWESEYFSGEK